MHYPNCYSVQHCLRIVQYSEDLPKWTFVDLLEHPQWIGRLLEHLQRHSNFSDQASSSHAWMHGEWLAYSVLIGSYFHDEDSPILLLIGQDLILRIEVFQQEAIFLPRSYGDDANLLRDVDRFLIVLKLWQDYVSSFTGFQYAQYWESDCHKSY